MNVRDEGITVITHTLDTLARNGRHSLARLLRDWRFSAGAALLLAVGIGANTAVFSILNNTLFLPHPFAQSDRLVNIYQNDAGTGEPEGVSYPAFLDLQQEGAVFSGVTAAMMREGRYQRLEASGTPGAIHNAVFDYTSANYLDVTGLRPALGRWFTAEEEGRAEPVAVLGWQVWQRDFGGDPAILGKTLVVSGGMVEIIGVAPKSLNNSQNNALLSSLWMPIGRLQPRAATVPGAPAKLLDRRDTLFLQVRARLRDGFSARQAQAAMNVVAQRLATDHPDADPKRGITVLPANDVHIHPREKFLQPLAYTVLSVVGLVLAIACSNLATLLLVRGSARTAELSVRLALGATRGDLLRLLLMESCLLSLAGAAAGIALAHLGLRYLGTIDLPVLLEMQLDQRVLGFTICVAALCGIGFGIMPALQATRLDVSAALREEKGSASGALSLARGWLTPKNVLVTAQVATSFLLLAGAMLAFGILSETQNRTVGYRAEGLAILEVDPGYAGYDLPRARNLMEEIRSRVQTLPGVDSVFVTNGLPGEGQFNSAILLDETQVDPVSVEGRWTGPGYFTTLEIPVLFGRVFDQRDTPSTPEVVVVSEAFARRFFQTPNAIGKRIRFAGSTRPVEIVGVVGNSRSIDMVLDIPESFVYRSAVHGDVMPSTLVARATRSEVELLGRLQQDMRRLHPELPVLTAITMKQRQAMELLPFRIAFISLGVLGALGLLLAAVGLYAVVSYAVAQRTGELGIRAALGAHPTDLAWLAVRDVIALVIAGIVLGSAISWAGLVLLEAFVPRMLGIDPVALVPVVLLILVCAAAAAFGPARRAVRTDPIAAIRHR